jgi:hypothetical protein
VGRNEASTPALTSALDEVLKFGESTIVSFRSKGEMEPFVVEFEGANETVIVMPARGG